MSKQFYVIVDEQSVIVRETQRGLTVAHAHAVVDGMDYYYQIVKDSSNVMKVGGSKIKKAMFGRGINQVHYHAKNAGNVVRFLPVSRKQSKKKEISEYQRGLF